MTLYIVHDFNML